MKILFIILLVTGYIFRVFLVKKIGSSFWRIVPPEKLITNGIYSRIRHPIYLSSLIMQFGIIGFFVGLELSLCFLFLSFNFIIDRIDREEQMLIGVFGEKYIKYMNKTKMLIPFIF